MGEKRWHDDAAVRILEDGKRELARLWGLKDGDEAPTDSDVVKHLKAKAAELDGIVRDRGDKKRLSVG